MIIEFFLNGIYSVVESVFNLLPVITLPSGLSSALGTFFSALSSAGYFVPLSDVAIVSAFLFLMYKLEVVIDIFHWVIRKIPGVS